jgi:hypothetical protein
VNTQYLDDLFFQSEKDQWTDLEEARAVHLGRVLTEIYTLKLKRDFPDRQFEVEFWDGSPEHGGEISLSFWQV